MGAGPPDGRGHAEGASEEEADDLVDVRGVVGTFSDGKSTLMLVTAGLKHVAEIGRGSRRHPDASLLDE